MALQSHYSKLKLLSKEDLIDLLLLPESEQKTEELRDIKTEINCNAKKIKLSVPSLNSDVCCCHCHNTIKPPSEENKNNDFNNDNAMFSVEKNDDGLENFVGVYMAYSIFHGYLNLVIPRTGTTEPHLEELMKDYEDKNKIKFPCYKLFLLIPKSTYCPPTLVEASNRILESETLEEKLISRAGVQKRSYKNSVYKIVSEKKGTPTYTYIVAEYATPVKTYKDVFTYNYGEESAVYKKNKDKVIAKFYQTLNKILQEHEACTNYCELVFYDDKDGRDLADILIERIQKLEN